MELILVISFVVLLLIGVPIAFSIGLSALLALLLSIDPMAGCTTVAQQMTTGLDSFTLLAIPFFILSGQLMNHGGIARRLIDFARLFIGRFPGGLAFINIISNMLFGAISGSAVASASAIGGIMSPVMRREGYSPPFSAAVNITSATTGLIIPPSNVLIVYSLASGGVSIAALFIAGYIPGILMGFALIAAASLLSGVKPKSAAAGQPEQIYCAAGTEYVSAYDRSFYGYHAGCTDLHTDISARSEIFGAASCSLRDHYCSKSVCRIMHSPGRDSSFCRLQCGKGQHSSRDQTSASLIRRHGPDSFAGHLFAGAQLVAAPFVGAFMSIKITSVQFSGKRM